MECFGHDSEVNVIRQRVPSHVKEFDGSLYSAHSEAVVNITQVNTSSIDVSFIRVPDGPEELTVVCPKIHRLPLPTNPILAANTLACLA